MSFQYDFTNIRYYFKNYCSVFDMISFSYLFYFCNAHQVRDTAAAARPCCD